VRFEFRRIFSELFNHSGVAVEEYRIRKIERHHHFCTHFLFVLVHMFPIVSCFVYQGLIAIGYATHVIMYISTSIYTFQKKHQAMSSASLEKEQEQREQIIKSSSVILIIAALSIYVGYHPPISDFCTNNITFTKINNVTIENPAIIDVHKTLGESGKVIQMYRTEGITYFSFVAAIIMTLCSGLLPCALLLSGGMVICNVVFSIMFIDLYFQDAIPSQCIDSFMGNNFAYYIMQIRVVLSIIALSLMALGLSITCCVYGLCKQTPKNVDKTYEREYV